MAQYSPYLSIVVPAYREEKTISKTLTKLHNSLIKTNKTFEIICVVDGTVDKTLDRVRKLTIRHLKVLFYENNRGKGHAVRYGMARARGVIVGFLDANGINPNSIHMLLQHLSWYNADIIIGSKRHPASKVKYPVLRRILSIGSQMIIKILLNINVKDTQVGVKLFRREVLKKILPRLIVKDWAFDVEVLAVSSYLGFKRIYEAPVELELSANKDTSRVFSRGFVRAVVLAFWDTLSIFYRLKITHYYDDSKADLWRRSPDLEFWQPKSWLKPL